MVDVGGNSASSHNDSAENGRQIIARNVVATVAEMKAQILPLYPTTLSTIPMMMRVKWLQSKIECKPLQDRFQTQYRHQEGEQVSGLGL